MGKKKAENSSISLFAGHPKKCVEFFKTKENLGNALAGALAMLNKVEEAVGARKFKFVKNVSDVGVTQSGVISPWSAKVVPNPSKKTAGAVVRRRPTLLAKKSAIDVNLVVVVRLPTSSAREIPVSSSWTASWRKTPLLRLSVRAMKCAGSGKCSLKRLVLQMLNCTPRLSVCTEERRRRIRHSPMRVGF
jgi:hypothetical protein